MGYFFHPKRAPKSKFAAKYERFLDYFCRSVFNFKLSVPDTKTGFGSHTILNPKAQLGYGTV